MKLLDRGSFEMDHMITLGWFLSRRISSVSDCLCFSRRASEKMLEVNNRNYFSKVKCDAYFNCSFEPTDFHCWTKSSAIIFNRTVLRLFSPATSRGSAVYQILDWSGLIRQLVSQFFLLIADRHTLTHHLGYKKSLQTVLSDLYEYTQKIS